MFGHGGAARAARYAQLERNDALRAELLRLEAADPSAAHADRIWEILDDYEVWPGARLVGPDGAEAAWRIAMRSDIDLQRRALEHLEIAVDLGDAPTLHYAALADRIAMHEGREQRYGTQVVTGSDGHTLEPWPIAEPEGLDARRAALGLEPFAAHLAALRAARPDAPT